MTPQKILHINIGELALSNQPVTVATVLGSCVSVFLFSEQAAVGGVVHYALPMAPVKSRVEEGLRYGNVAISALIHELEHRYRVTSAQLSAKIIGGAAVQSGDDQVADIGRKNIDFARKLLMKLGIKVIGESVGGQRGRNVRFHIPSGRVQVSLLQGGSHLQELPLRSSLSTSKPKMTATRPKVLIVDDSKTVRQLLVRILGEDGGFEVLPPAASAMEASEAIKTVRPDVITLDIHMPGMSGVQWLERLLPVERIPVVMISSLQLQEGNEVFRALELGAVDYIQKPSLSELPVAGPNICEKVRMAAAAKVTMPRQAQRLAIRPQSNVGVDFRKTIVIGASTGGVEALKSILCQMPKVIPPILIVQHIPPHFSKAFADRINELCSFSVKEAEDGDEIAPSQVLIAPGGKQMKIKREKSGKIVVCITDDAPMNRHKPSVDYLFHSAAEVLGSNAVGVILTGMGNDGANGLLRLKNVGAHTIGQDEDSCVVYGMPKAAFELGAVGKVASLDQMPQVLLDTVAASLPSVKTVNS